MAAACGANRKVTMEKLDDDFITFMEQMKSVMKRLPEDKQKLGRDWIMYLMGKPAECLREKMLRNSHLADLFGEMSEGKLWGLYATQPPSIDQPFPPLQDPVLLVSETPKEKEKVPCKCPSGEIPNWIQDLLGDSDESPDEDESVMLHTSRDGQTYIATKAMPDGSGIMGFVSVNTEERNLDSDENECPEQAECPEMPQEQYVEITERIEESSEWCY